MIFETDLKLAPKVRYCLVLLNQLKNEGYKYLKSKNEFVKGFELGEHRLSLQFVSTMGIIHSVGFHLKIIFSDLEREYKKVIQEDHGNWTVALNLSYLNDYLCDEETGEYTDITINTAANSFFQEIYPKLNDAFISFGTYGMLSDTYNQKPISYLSYSPSIKRRTLFSLFMAKIFLPKNYEELKIELINFYTKHTEKIKGKKEDISELIEKIETYQPVKSIY